jgi:copper(I)-binding protein
MTIMEAVRSTAVVLFALAAICVGPASAQQVKAGDLVIDHAWTRASPGSAQVGAGYLTIENRGVTPECKADYRSHPVDPSRSLRGAFTSF